MSEAAEIVLFPDRLTEPAGAVSDLLNAWPADDLLQANLQALARVDPDLAGRVAGAVSPAGVELAVTLDGVLNFKTPPDAFGAEWLGYSALPWYASGGAVERMEAASSNLAMPGVGHGYLARLILERKAGPAQALFVIGPEQTGPRDLRLMFQLHDLSESIATGRLVFLCQADPVAALIDFYDRHEGYQIVTTSVVCPWWSRAENNAFNRQMADAMETVAGRQQRRIETLQAQWHGKAAARRDSAGGLRIGSNPRVANLMTAMSREDYYQSRDLLAGFAQRGAPTEWLALRQPDQIAMTWQLRQMNRLEPDLIVLVNTFRHNLPLALPAEIPCVSLCTLAPAQWPARLAGLMGPDDLILCPEPAALPADPAGECPVDRILRCGPLVNTALFHPPAEPAEPDGRLGSDIALIAERHSLQPELYQISLPSHQQLWQRVIEAIGQDPAGYCHATAPRYLSRAQTGGVQLREKELRDRFLDRIRDHVARSVLLDSYCQFVLARGYDLKIWDWARPFEEVNDRIGSTWRESVCRDRVAGVVPYAESLNRLYQSVKIVLEIEPHGQPTAGLLSAIAAGAFVLVRVHPQPAAREGLARLFRPGEELITFDTPDDLIRKLRHYLDHPEQRRLVAGRARARLLESLTAGHAVDRLLTRLR